MSSQAGFSRAPVLAIAIDTSLSVHFNEFSRYLVDYLARETPNARSSARQKLERLTSQQIEELRTDVYDELMRRKTDAVPFLPARNDVHPKRNEARQKLATLPISRFQDLASDVYYELARRHPHLREDADESSSRADYAQLLRRVFDLAPPEQVALPALRQPAPDRQVRASKTPYGGVNDARNAHNPLWPVDVAPGPNSLRIHQPSEALLLGSRSGETAGIIVETSPRSAFLARTAVVGHLLDVLLEELQRGVRDGSEGSIQAASDVLDRALLVAAPSHPAYGSGIRQLRRWCTKFSLLPTSCLPISISDIRLESSRPKFTTQNSDVFRAVFAGTSVAVKSLRLHTGDNVDVNPVQRAFYSEVITWKHLRHRNIVPFLGICDMSPVCLVSEWMEEGTISGFLERHPGERRTNYILGVVRALEFMHSLKVVHGDIKAMNVLVDRDRNARLADFGLVSTLSNATIATAHFTSGGARGTGRWMAPELFKDAESPRSDLSDIYALAITVWEIFILQVPFSQISNDFTLLFHILEGGRPPRPEGCEAIGFSDELWEVMQQAWATQPQSRPPLSAFANLLQKDRKIATG